MSPVSSGATDGASRSRTQSARALISSAHASAIETPSIVEDRVASDSRVPSQSGHATVVKARSTNSRMCGCIDSRSFVNIDFRIRGTRPS